MIDELVHNFLLNRTEIHALTVLAYLRKLNMISTFLIIGEFFCEIFKYSYMLKIELATVYFINKEYNKVDDIYNTILNMKGITEIESAHIFKLKKLVYKYIENDKLIYNIETIKKIRDDKRNCFPLVTMSITSCKRLDLFKQTVNSILNCFDIDNIDYFFCVDDNSSDKDREEMKKLYPFFTFYFKTYEEKGHANSMNIIKKYVQNVYRTPYLLHFEDDWNFFKTDNYIEKAISILEEDISYKQYLFNKNYTELITDNINGGIFKISKLGYRYYEHEYVSTPEQQIQWTKKHGFGNNCNYWPFYSFRPSIIKTEIFNVLGDFNIHANHFEMDYAYKFAQRGYKSVFDEHTVCKHIGRLTSQINDKEILNAYQLNNEDQFYKDKTKDQIYNVFVINLERRKDRYDKLVNLAKPLFSNIQRFNAIDGLELKPNSQLAQIFENNDYNYRASIIGCCMSHITLYIQLINSKCLFYLILEDDVTFITNFDKYYTMVLDTLFARQDWDICYLGYSSRVKYQADIHNVPHIKQWTLENTSQSLGGNFAYFISKKGAIKLLELINITGMTNAIDTIIQINANNLKILYLEPSIVFTDCANRDENNGKIIDSDIQYSYNSIHGLNNFKYEQSHRFKRNNKYTVDEAINLTITT